MADDYILRMTWRDEGTAVVHAVEFDIEHFTPRGARDRMLARKPTRLAFHYNADAVTVCNEALPTSGTLYRDEQITCEACLEADGWPAVEAAERLLADAARSLAVWP